MDKRIVIVGAGGLGPSIAKEIIEWAQANSIEIVEADPVVTPRDELEAMFKEARFAIDHHVYVVAALQEEAELEFIESILETYDVSIIAMPHSDGVTWFKQKYPKALVYSWQQAQDIDFHRKRAPYIGSYELCQIIDLNEVINDGRGSSVVRSIISELERGNYDGAAQVATIDSDKVRQYPEMFDLLLSLGYQVD
jgi:hypothetical protein